MNMFLEFKQTENQKTVKMVTTIYFILENEKLTLLKTVEPTSFHLIRDNFNEMKR